MRSTGEVIAVVCADLHLSLKPPAARAKEEDWLLAMAQSVEQLRDLSEDLPILCAGDIFHHWKAEPELINWAIEHLPKMYAIPGQHDLPLHNYDDLKRSAYWTLVEAGIISNLRPRAPHFEKPLVLKENTDIAIHPFAWGHDLVPVKSNVTTKLNIALIHRYVWTEGNRYPTAPDEAHLKKNQKIYATYDACVFGDNHQGFFTSVGKESLTTIWNCGTFMRRTSDEIDYRPRIGLLHDTGLIEPHYLAYTHEKMEKVSEPPLIQDNEKVREFIRTLVNMEHKGLDFEKAVLAYIEMNKLNPITRDFVLGALDRD